MSWGRKHYARFDDGEDDDEDAPQDISALEVEAGRSAGGTPGRSPTGDASSRAGTNGHVSPVAQSMRSPSTAGRSPIGLSPQTIGATFDDTVEAADEITKPSPLPEDAAADGSPMATKKPVEVVKERRLASNGRTFVNSLTCFIGAATYTLPACFQNIGLVGGITMLAMSAAISAHCMFLLVDLRVYLEKVEGKRIKTYGDLGYYAFGVLGARVVDTFIMLTQFGFCVCYFIVVSQTVSQMFPQVTKSLCIYLMIPLLVRASWLKSLRSLAKVSLVAETGMFLSLGMVMFYIVHRLVYGAWETTLDPAARFHSKASAPLESDSASHPLVMFNVLGLTNFFGVSICVFEGVGMVLPVYNSMKNPDSFKPIWGSTIALVTAMYMFFGAFGYVAYRPDIEDIILANLPAIPLTIVVKLCFCVGLYLTYPLMLFPVIEIWEEMAGRTVDANSTIRQSLSWNCARSVLVVLTGVLAMYIPKLNLFIALIGASGSTMLAFVLPTSFKLRLRWSDMSWFERLREAACLFIGAVGGTISTIAAVKDLREAYLDEALLEAAGGI